MRQASEKLVQFGRDIETISVLFQEGAYTNVVGVVVVVLGNGVRSKLNRQRKNSKMRVLSEDWVMLRNNSEQGDVSLTRILMKHLMLR